jgi:hypothetical protein
LQVGTIRSLVPSPVESLIQIIPTGIRFKDRSSLPGPSRELNVRYGRSARLPLARNPTIKSNAVFNVATRLPENVFGCPHHKHDALATLAGLPHAEQTFARRIKVFFLENVAVGRDVN